MKAMLAYVDDEGGRRIDDANTYFHENTTKEFLSRVKTPRSEIFVTNKIGAGLAFPPKGTPASFVGLFPFGYQEAIDQGVSLAHFTGYSDIIMMHYPYSGWPGIAPGSAGPQSTDPLCNTTAKTFDGAGCRISTYRGMLEVWKRGLTRSVGVSNFNETQLNEIKNAGLPMPAVLQNPLNPHRKQKKMIEYCKKHDILFNGYSPLGVPDAHIFPQIGSDQNSPGSLLEEPSVKAAAKKHSRSPAQVLINWQWQQGAVTNPRSDKPAHMRENLDALDFTLDSTDMEAISNIPDATCETDPNWYECAPTKKTCPPMHCNYMNKPGELCTRATKPCEDCPPSPFFNGGCWPCDV
jgi:diketogulonate reductase-like aldo/keto reductase